MGRGSAYHSHTNIFPARIWHIDYESKNTPPINTNLNQNDLVAPTCVLWSLQFGAFHSCACDRDKSLNPFLTKPCWHPQALWLCCSNRWTGWPVLHKCLGGHVGTSKYRWLVHKPYLITFLQFSIEKRPRTRFLNNQLKFYTDIDILIYELLILPHCGLSSLVPQGEL